MNLYDKASLILTPNAYKAGKLYALKPTNGSGDFTFSRASARTRRNASGLIESLANNVPALEYPVGGGCPAWLFEPQRTNTALWSQDFTGAGWSGYNASAASNTHTAPDGTLTADTISITVNGGYFRRDGISIANNTTYTLSCYFRNIGLTAGQTFSMYLNNNLSSPNGATIYVTIDLAALTAVPVVSGIASGASASIAQISTEWSRVTLTFTAGATAAASNCEIGFEAVSTPRSFVAWGIQLEVGAFATSYIPTTGSIATRIGDYYSLNYGGSTSGGTWFVHLLGNLSLSSDSAVSAPYIGTSQSSGTSGWSFTLRQGGGNQRASIWKYENGVGTALTAPTTDESKMAVSWNGSTANVYINGVKVVTNTSFNQSSLPWLAAGNSIAPGRPINMRSQIIAVEPLSDAECIALTTL